MKIAICTLGCKVNQYETQALETELRRRGHSLTAFEDAADAYIVNTCAVTAMSGHKSRQMIRRCRKQNPAALVAVCGCYAQIDAETVGTLGVDLIAGSDRRMEFVDELERMAAERQGEEAARQGCRALQSRALHSDDGAPGRRAPQGQAEPEPLVTVGDIMSTKTFEELPAGGLEGRTRAMLKVEDGCVNFCSYCIIPYARGPVRSLPLKKAAEEAKSLGEKGYKEIVLTGIELSSWGRDLDSGEGLADLIEGVCAAAPGCRVRLGSLEPRSVTEEFCRRISGLHNLCPHFHLSMQSGCDATLKRMNRKYDTARYYESVALLRKYYVNPGITTDMIVGFPGETEEEFGQTLKFIEKCGFTAMHIFPYSRRSGTAADRMPGQLSAEVKEKRGRRAAKVARAMEKAYLQSWVGQELPVLFEEEKGGFYRGHAPNYVEVRVPPREGLHNTERWVRITALGTTGLVGELAEE